MGSLGFDWRGIGMSSAGYANSHKRCKTITGKKTINGVSRFMKAATRSMNSEVACAA